MHRSILKMLLHSTRVKIPFGIAQIGKAFRNEITPGNFTFRVREFEQMEVRVFTLNPMKQKQTNGLNNGKKTEWIFMYLRN